MDIIILMVEYNALYTKGAARGVLVSICQSRLNYFMTKCIGHVGTTTSVLTQFLESSCDYATVRSEIIGNFNHRMSTISIKRVLIHVKIHQSYSLIGKDSRIRLFYKIWKNFQDCDFFRSS